MPTFHVPAPGERPDVEVLVDGGWWPGELRLWTRHADGSWTAQMQWRREMAFTRIDSLLAAKNCA